MKAVEVAKYIINKAIDQDKPISNLQLQKILYFSHIETIRATKEKLIDEKFEAWDYGPVCREVYNEFILYGANKIELSRDIKEYPSEEICNIINRTINKYIDMSPWELVAENKKEHSAWKATYRSGEKRIISDEEITSEANNTLSFFTKIKNIIMRKRKTN